MKYIAPWMDIVFLESESILMTSDDSLILGEDKNDWEDF